MENKSNRIIYYDLIKLLAGTMVVFYHLNIVDMGYRGETFYIPNFNRIFMNLCSTSVPLFFMVSGALILNRQEVPVMTTLKKAAKIFLIYFVWSKIIGGILAIITMDYTRINIDIFIRGMLSGNYSLWFLRTLAMLYILSPVLKWVYDNKNKIYIKGIVGFLIILPFMYNYIIIVIKLIGIDAYNLNNLPRTGFLTLYSIVYFVFGGYISTFIKNNKENIKKYRKYALGVFIIGLLLSITEVVILTNINSTMFDGVNSSFPTIGALFMSLGIFYILSTVNINFDTTMYKIIKFIGTNAIGVYIFHLPFVYLYRHLTSIEYVNLILVIIITLIIVTISSVINSICMRIPVFRTLLKL